jgi:hypothetical protein
MKTHAKPQRRGEKNFAPLRLERPSGAGVRKWGGLGVRNGGKTTYAWFEFRQNGGWEKFHNLLTQVGPARFAPGMARRIAKEAAHVVAPLLGTGFQLIPLG